MTSFCKMSLKNQFGFSLVTVMVLLVIVGLSVGASFKLFSVQLISANTIEGHYELNALRDSISEIFFDTESCRASLEGVSPETGIVTTVKVKRTTTGVAQDVYIVASSQRYNRLIEFTNFSLDSGGVSISANSTAITEFVITASIARDTFGSDEIQRRIVLEVSTDSSGNIASCGVSLADQRRVVLQYICNTLGGDFISSMEECQHLTLYADIPGINGALNLVSTVPSISWADNDANTLLQEVARYTCLTLGGDFDRLGRGGLGDCGELSVTGKVEVLNESATPGSLVIENSGEVIVR